MSVDFQPDISTISLTDYEAASWIVPYKLKEQGGERLPLARPVEPLVYMMTATSSGQGLLWTKDANKQ